MHLLLFVGWGQRENNEKQKLELENLCVWSPCLAHRRKV